MTIRRHHSTGYSLFVSSLVLSLSAFSFSIISGCGSNESQKGTDLLPVVRIHPFLQKNSSCNRTRIAVTSERKIIELLSNNGFPVLSHLIRPLNQSPDYHIKGSVSESDSLYTLHVTLSDDKKHTLSSGTVTGTDDFFRAIRGVTGETALHACKVDLSLKPRKTVPACTSSSAWALYLTARQKATAGQNDRAIALMRRALAYDPGFTAGVSVIAALYREQGLRDSVAARERKTGGAAPSPGQTLDYKEHVDTAQPLKNLLEASAGRPFTALEAGLEYKRVTVPGYAVTAFVWIADPNRFTVDIRMQQGKKGCHIEEFLRESADILALNGGFFEIGRDYSHTPSGLIFAGNTLHGPVTSHGGSGIFCITQATPSIIWTKDSINPAEYTLALQSGPVIVEPGGRQGVYGNSYRRCSRSAIGIAEGKVVFAVIEGNNGSGLSLYEFAEFLRSDPIGCDAALNLDGGSSTQVHCLHTAAPVSVSGLWKINSAILLARKE